MLHYSIQNIVRYSGTKYAHTYLHWKIVFKRLNPNFYSILMNSVWYQVYVQPVFWQYL